MIKWTGVTISEEHYKELLKLQQEVQSTPMAKVHGSFLYEDALELFKCRVDEMAIAAGLPPPGKIDGVIDHYGVDSASRQFTRYVPDPPKRGLSAEEFQKIFPDEGIALKYLPPLKHTSSGERSEAVWAACLLNNPGAHERAPGRYGSTSWDITASNGSTVYGASVEEVLGALAENMVEQIEGRAKMWAKNVAESEGELARIRDRIAAVTKSGDGT